MFKRFVNKAYPPFINIYTVWILYLLYFASFRQDYKQHFTISIIPLDTIYKYIFIYIKDSVLESVKNLLGNIILFIPYGFLGILYPKLKQFGWLFLTFFIIINLIEFFQYYFKRGFADVDDVMLNTLGMSIGYIIYKKWFFIRGR